jgi:beta-glucosidase/6-phospho-beta-glucosidase/beta-galactosidase
MSISFKNFYSEATGIGNIFALSEEGLYEQLEKITHAYRNITFVNEAGVRELQFKGEKPKPRKILEDYYGN